jgi:hypothetical protein
MITGMIMAGLAILGCVPDLEDPVSDPNIGEIRLTEIHYNPAPFGNYSSDDLEFLELKNTGSQTVNLNALVFSSGVDYEFPEGTSVEGGGFYVIASNRGAFSQRYGFDPDGIFSGQLKNSGESIEITDRALDAIIISQTYSDRGSWAKGADGGGYSLVPVNPNPAKNDTGSAHWRRSSKIGGSPGEDDEPLPFDSTLYNLRITEIMYHPDYIDSTGEDSLEFIELKNTGATALTLTDVAFTDGIAYAFSAGTILQPGAFFVLASDVNWFKERYSFEPSGTYSGQLRNSGETITLQDVKSGITIISITYADDAPWPPNADGDGWSMVTKAPDPALSDMNNPAAWRQSFRLNGSPGKDDPGPVYINEVLTHTDLPQTDAIELYNPNSMDIDIGGWYLTDNLDDPEKFRIPAGTTIPANGYLVFDESDFNADTSSGVSFRFSEYGEKVYICADASGKWRGEFYHGFSFGAIENGVSFGRYINSVGTVDFVAQTAVSLGAENMGPRVGPIVITEIMYNPEDSLSEFIEVKNISDGIVKLYDADRPDSTWKIDGLEFSFPTGTSLKAGEIALVVTSGVPLDEIKTRYSIPNGIQLFSTPAMLGNSGDTLSILRPYIDSASLTLPELPYVTIDRVVFKDGGWWPSEADGTGKSLQRIDPKAYANDPTNWKAADPTAGK